MKTSIGRYFRPTGEFILEEGPLEYGWQNRFRPSVPGNPDPLTLIPIAGDWDGDGLDTVGLYDPALSNFWLFDANDSSASCVGIQFGSGHGGWLPIVGNWDGRTTGDKIGLYHIASSQFHLRLSNTPGNADLHYHFGAAGHRWLPVAGDWKGIGIDYVGLFNPADARWYLNTRHDSGSAEIHYPFGSRSAGQTPLAGDWLGNGIDHVGVYHPYEVDPDEDPATMSDCYYPFFLKHNHTPGDNRNTLRQCAVRGDGYIPITGKWKASSNAWAPGINTTPPAPAWLANSVICQLRIDTATQGGKIADVEEMLSYLASICTCIWICPPWKHLAGHDNYYEIVDHTKIDAALSRDWTEIHSALEMKSFVQAAHAQGLRVIVDAIPHGVHPSGPLWRDHPEWFVYDRENRPIAIWGGTYELHHGRPGLRQWWHDTMVQLALEYDFDGFRCDLEPGVTGFHAWNQIISTCRQRGKELAIISEGLTPRRYGAYHVSQEDTGLNSPSAYVPEFITSRTTDLASWIARPESVESYYSSALSVHDRSEYGMRGRGAYAAYAALISPLSPVIFFLGDERNKPRNRSPLYHDVTWQGWADNAQQLGALAQWQRLLRIRRQLNLWRSPLQSVRCSMLPTTGGGPRAYTISNGSEPIVVVPGAPNAGVRVDLGELGPLSVGVADGDAAVLKMEGA